MKHLAMIAVTSISLMSSKEQMCADIANSRANEYLKVCKRGVEKCNKTAGVLALGVYIKCMESKNEKK